MIYSIPAVSKNVFGYIILVEIVSYKQSPYLTSLILLISYIIYMRSKQFDRLLEIIQLQRNGGGKMSAVKNKRAEG